MPLLYGLAFRVFVAPRALRGRSLDELIREAQEAASEFLATVSGVPIHRRFSAYRRSELASAADQLAHLSACNLAYAEVLLRMAAGAEHPVDFELFEPFAGAGNRSWEELDRTHHVSFCRLIDALRSVPPQARSGRHPWIGRLSTEGWALLVGLHYRYHTKEIVSLLALSKGSSGRFR